jgi:ADP-heptose:LPS heptosyltransferase
MINGGLGDCLLATPFLRHFRISGVYGRITCAIPAAAKEIFDRNPYIDQLIPCTGADLFIWGAPEKDCDTFAPYRRVLAPTRVGGNMDVTQRWNLPAPNLSSEPVISQLAKYHGIPLADESMEIVTEESDKQWAEAYTSRWRGKPVVLLNTVSHRAEKNLPQSIAQQIIDRLSDTFHMVQFALGAPPFRAIETIPVPGIRKSAELFKRLASIITVDSFPGHLARAVDLPAVVLFGPSNPATFGHAGNVNICSNSCPPCADTKRLPRCKRSRCMEEIVPDQVVEAVRSITEKIS